MVSGYGDQLALVEVEGARRRVNIGLLEGDPPAPGEWVVIHMGFVVERVDAAGAERAREGLRLMGRGLDDP
jgi:hydrogenase expression/formation protein HypC